MTATVPPPPRTTTTPTTPQPPPPPLPSPSPQLPIFPDSDPASPETFYSTLTCVSTAPCVFLLDGFLSEEECRGCEASDGPFVDAMMSRIGDLLGAPPTEREVYRLLEYPPVPRYCDGDDEDEGDYAGGRWRVLGRPFVAIGRWVVRRWRVLATTDGGSDDDASMIADLFNDSYNAQFPNGLHVDVNNGYWMRHASALVYLDDVDVERHGGATVFPVVVNADDDEDDDVAAALAAAEELIAGHVLHTLQGDVNSDRPDLMRLTTTLLAEACGDGASENKGGLRIAPRRGRLCIFLNYDDDGRVDPCTWHGAEGLCPTERTEADAATNPRDDDDDDDDEMVQRRLWTVFKEMPLEAPEVEVTLEDFAASTTRKLKRKLLQRHS